jgi:hypothetical protein
MEEAFEEGQGPCRAVDPMMIMMMTTTTKHISTLLSRSIFPYFIKKSKANLRYYHISVYIIIVTYNT